MIRAWPAMLPGLSYTEAELRPVDNARRTDMEAGARRARPVSRARLDHMTVSWLMEDGEFEAFRAWWGDEPWSAAGESDSLAAWTLSGATREADTVPVPGIGAALADRLIETSAAGEHRASLSLPALAVDDVPVRVRIALRAAGRSRARVSLITRSGAAAGVLADLAAGTVSGATGGAQATLADAGSGWWRLSLLASTGAGAQVPAIQVQLADGAGLTSYAGGGVQGMDLGEVLARRSAGEDLYVRTGADGRALGAAQGSAWFRIELPLGGGLREVEARFAGGLSARPAEGLRWSVTAPLEVRHA